MTTARPTERSFPHHDGAHHGMRSSELSDASRDFSLVLGGPIYQFLRRIGLIRPPLDRIAWRIGVITLVAWAPLLVLSALGGRLVGGVKVPFLRDFEVHARLLAALPLLIGAEVAVHGRIRLLLFQFVDRQIVGRRAVAGFEACIQSATRLRNSTVVEMGLLAFVLFAASFWLRDVLTIRTDTWYASAGGQALTAAGWWYESVSLPIVQFITLRWYYRLFIWARMLRQVSRLDLTLVPTHPDGCCGLGFLGEIAPALGPLLMAHSILLAGYLANRILYEGTRLPDYGPEIVAVALFLYLLALGPISVFAPRLIRQRLQGLRTYGALASEYVIGFERKWVDGDRDPAEPLVGSGDIQSLADLANSFGIVQHVRPLPFGRTAIVGVAAFVAIPLLPLALTMFSLRELVTRLLQVLL